MLVKAATGVMSVYKQSFNLVSNMLSDNKILVV